MSASSKQWYAGLRCQHCGQIVKVSAIAEGASFHRPAVGEPWAEHHVCPKPEESKR